VLGLAYRGIAETLAQVSPARKTDHLHRSDELECRIMPKPADQIKYSFHCVEYPQPQARSALAQDARSVALRTFERFSAQVGAVEFQQVEGIEGGVRLPSSPAHGAL
jgi:hypothetical protein